MNREKQIGLGEELFYGIVRNHPLMISEKIVKVYLHEEFGYHNDTYLYLDVIGESGKKMWRYPDNMPIDHPLEQMQAIGEYLSTLFSCPLEIKMI